MPTPAKPAAPEVSNEPTVSVAEAMGLPKDWDFAKSVSGKDDSKLENHVTREEAGGPPEEETTRAETETETETESEASEGEQTGDKKDGEKPAEKPAAKPAAKAEKKTTAKEKPVVKEGEKPAEKPAAKPAAKPVEKTAETPAKIKVGGKEYTQAELEEKLAAADKPVVKPVTAVEKPKELTAEEKVAQQKDIDKKEGDWISSVAKTLTAPIDEATLDTILAGGPEAVTAMQQLRTTDMARSILEARKSMFADLQPILDDLRNKQEPFITQQTKDADEREWTTFSTENPSLAKYRKASEAIAQALVEREPTRLKDMTMDQFRAEVATRTKKMLKEDLSIDADALYELEKAAKAEAAAAEGEGTEGEGTEGEGEKPAEKPAAKPAAKPVERAKVKPPGANPPVATPTKGSKGKGGEDSEIIASMW